MSNLAGTPRPQEDDPLMSSPPPSWLQQSRQRGLVALEIAITFVLLFVLCTGGIFLASQVLPRAERCEANPGPSLDPNLLAANGLLYLNSPASHSLYAIDMTSGSIRWTSQVTGYTLLDGDLLYLNETGYIIKALDASSGTPLWQKNGRRNGSAVSTLFAATDHLAYLAGDDGLLEAVNGRDGTVLWQHVLKDAPSATLTDDPSSLHVTGGVVYLSTANSSVFAFRERDGALLWQFHTTAGNRLNRLQSTAFGDGMIFLSADQIYALRLSDGKLLWHATEQGTLLEAQGLLFLHAPPGSSDPANPASAAGVFAFRADTGAQVWHHPFAPGDPVGSARLQLSDHRLFLFPASVQYGPATPLVALSASDGTRLWEDTLSVRSMALVALRGTLYLFSAFDRVWGPGLLEALRETDGTALWSRSLHEAGMVVTDTAIYAGIAGNTDSDCATPSSAQVEKLQLSDASPLWYRQLDPAPDPLLLTKVILAVLGGLLVVLGVLAFFVTRKEPPQNRLPSPLLEGPDLAFPAVPLPLIKRFGWLLLFIPGIVLLLVAATLAVQ